MQNRIKLNKKGMVESDTMAPSALTILIVSITVILVLFFLVKDLGSTVVDAGRKQMCENSAKQHAELHLSKFDFSNPINCPTEYIPIPKDEADIVTYRRLGKELVDAWDVFQNGNRNLFSEETVYCHVYTVFEFKDDTRILEGLTEFLATEKPPLKEVSYLEYLRNDITSEAHKYAERIDAADKPDPNIMYGNKDYAVIFVYAKGKDAINKFRDSIGAGAFAIGGGVLGGAAVGVATGILISSNPIGWFVGATAAIAGGIYLAVAGDDADWGAAAILREYTSETLTELKCEKFPVSQSEKNS